ncbi:hypothetical protein CRI94_17165 [Longibacter salinarum]|uniref:WH2 domain-containing protein n=1 Tax=Longibacter salinarum TaxID=1850348 RepID=A0A2A8CTI3_9BACT|nr:hypothetical protein CRI94_17165 [Longibacter salinarum]
MLEDIPAAVRSQHDDVLDAIRSGVLDELKPAAEKAADQFDAARKTRLDRFQTLRSGAESDPIPTDARDVIRDYRRASVETVLVPLAETLRFVDTGVVLRSARQGLQDARASLTTQQPDHLERAEPDALYEADEADGTIRSIRKTWIRGMRRVRSWVSSGEDRIQTVPVAQLVDYHLRHRLPVAEKAVLLDIEQNLARWVARLERAATEWIHATLRVEAAVDRLDSEARQRLDTAPSSDDPESQEPTSDRNDPGEQESEAVRQLRVMETTEKAFLDVLHDAASLTLDDAEDRLRRLAQSAQEAFENDTFRAGSFMAKRRRVKTPPETPTGRWVEWHRQATARLAMGHHLSEIRDIIHTEQASMTGAIVDAGISPARQLVRDALRQLKALREEVDSLLALPAPGTERHLIQDLDAVLDRALDLLENELAAALRQTTVRRDTEAVVQARIDTIRLAIDEQPDTFVVHALPADPEAPISPDAPSHTVQWTSILEETTAVLLFDAWRALLPPIADTVLQVTSTADDVIGIVRFNLGAAMEEVQDLLVARRRDETSDEIDQGHLEAARELALDGLDRAAALLTDSDRPMVDAGLPIARAVRSTTTATWARIHERVRAAGRAREQVLRARALSESYLRTATEWSQATGRELRIRLRRTLQLGQRRAEKIVQMGQTAVGTGEVDDAVIQETVAAVIGLGDELSEMPLVYRRLFSLRPVRDPDLLVGRTADIQRVEQHVRQWENGLPNALIITGDPGSGMTSLVNVLSATSLRRARRYTIELTERYTEEADVARVFARVLGLTRTGDPETLDELAARIREQPTNARHRVVLVEHMEHLFLRAVHGTGLLARVVEFMSATDSRLIWIGTISGFGWQILQAHEPDAAGLVVRHALTPFGRETIEELIIRRHRRSGLALTFEAPDESAQPLLARRLARAETPEARQEMLRQDYFDRLHSLCGQNVMLALFHWFRSVRMDEDGSGIRVAPVRPIRFDFLDTFSVRQSFALKALLEHASLTVSELAQVLQLSPEKARTILEALGNAQLIAPAETIGIAGTYAFDGVEPDIRYRVRPMVLHPVARHLRSRNIVH